MKKNQFIFLVLISFTISQVSKASIFKVEPVDTVDKKIIKSIFAKQDSLWVPTKELKKYPGLYWQDDLQAQSFKITSTQVGIEDTYFVPIQADYTNGTKGPKAWSQSLSILLIDRKKSTIVKLPDHPVIEWNFDHIEGIAFRDIQGNGKRSIVVNAAGITGMGENGAVPFNLVAVYLQNTDGTWKLDPDLQKKIDDQMYTKCKKASCRDLKTISKFAENYFKKNK